MNRSLFNECTVLFFIFLFNFNVDTNDQINFTEGPVFSGAFESFLKDLGTILNKSKSRSVKPTISLKQFQNDVSRKTTPRSSWGSVSRNYNSQKAVLNDVLMMKLVSYYEDKYRLAHRDPPTDKSLTLTGAVAVNANRKKYNVMDDVDGANPDKEKKKYVKTTISPSFDTLFEFFDNPHTTSNTIQITENNLQKVEEVINVMDYIPQKSDIDGVQIIMDDYANPNVERSHNKIPEPSPIIEISKNNVNYQRSNVERSLNALENRLPNAERARNPVENRSPNFKRIQNVDYVNSQVAPVPDIIYYSQSSGESVRNVLDNRVPPDEGERIVLDERSQNIERSRIVLDNNGSPEGGSVRSFLENGPSAVSREQIIFSGQTQNNEKPRNNMHSTRPNVNRMRIIIGTSPIDRSTRNQRKSNDDSPISEVIVI